MADQKTEQPATPAAAPPSAPAPSSGGGKTMLILTGVNLLLTLGVGAVLFMSFSKDQHKASVNDISLKDDHGNAKAEGGHGEENGKEGAHGERAPASAQYGKIIPLEEFTVNLSSVGTVSPKYARVNISIEVPSTDVETEVTHKVPQVRNTIIDLFNSKRPADLATAEGRANLKEEIRAALNTFLVSGKVKGVFFTSFAVSS